MPALDALFTPMKGRDRSQSPVLPGSCLLPLRHRPLGHERLGHSRRSGFILL